MAEKAKAAVARQRQRQLGDLFDEERTGSGTPVVRYGKQAAGGRDAAVVPVARAESARQGASSEERRRAIAGDAVSFRKGTRGIEPASTLRVGGKRSHVAV